MSFDGRNLVWSDCVREGGEDKQCVIRYVGRSTASYAGQRVHDVQGDSRWVFYANSTGVHRHAR
ncbi:hypothetical protein M1L60_31125 [Actinoplanes sp. TRM 88003]|uniref:Uncharacterized protein n=1 Tax=Paractinoplanes aksuensis TaxID=2939490 RepID=A0ABT1DW91_9ACTN|nr:hypothetical protein [Actinoplanes aksuensis]MCO8275040.1 hypothetical protein [Actinoplanes aksuensis]